MAKQNDLSGSELIEKVFEVEDLNPTSFNDFGRFLNLVGYEGDAMTAAADFLQDNPGAIEAILEWLADHIDENRRENLEACLPEEDEEDEDEPIGYTHPWHEFE